MVFPQRIGPGRKYMEAHSAQVHGIDHRGNLERALDAHFDESTQNVNVQQTQQVPNMFIADSLMPESFIEKTKHAHRPFGATTIALEEFKRVQPGFYRYR